MKSFQNLRALYGMIALLVILAISSCTEESLPTGDVSSAEKSPFSLSLDVDGSFFDLNNPNYIIKTHFENNDGLNKFSGTYLETGCVTDCGPSLTVSFYDVEKRELQDVKINEVLIEKSYEFASDVALPIINAIKFQAISNPATDAQEVELCWSDGMGNEVCGVTSLVDTTFFPITLSARYADGTVIGYTRAVSLIQNDIAGSVMLSPPEICINRSDDPSFFILSVDNLQTGDTVIWSIPSASQDRTNDQIKVSAKDLIDPIKVQVFNTINLIDNTNEITIAVDPNRFDKQKCFSGFQIFTTDLAGSRLYNGTVELEYTDSQGNVYLSDGSSSSINQHFEVFNIMDFEPDPDGNPTKIFYMEFSAQLVNFSSGQIIRVGNASGTFAISYPGK